MITSGFQKASILGRWGDGGIRNFFEGECRLGFDGLDGGVVGRIWSVDLCTDLVVGGENLRHAPGSSLKTVVDTSVFWLVSSVLEDLTERVFEGFFGDVESGTDSVFEDFFGDVKSRIEGVFEDFFGEVKSRTVDFDNKLIFSPPGANSLRGFRVRDGASSTSLAESSTMKSDRSSKETSSSEKIARGVDGEKLR